MGSALARSRVPARGRQRRLAAQVSASSGLWGRVEALGDDDPASVLLEQGHVVDQERRRIVEFDAADRGRSRDFDARDAPLAVRFVGRWLSGRARMYSLIGVGRSNNVEGPHAHRLHRRPMASPQTRETPRKRTRARQRQGSGFSWFLVTSFSQQALTNRRALGLVLDEEEGPPPNRGSLGVRVFGLVVDRRLLSGESKLDRG
jgi:hypothetical protein